MTLDELDKLRFEDIEFFARRYSELFGDYFNKNTTQEKEEFYKQIKTELLGKAPRYIIVDDMIEAQGQSYYDRIEFSQEYLSVENRAIRIHELFHSYNHMDNNVNGLKNFNTDFILKNLDEGSTEMFSQMMCGNFKEEPDQYSSEVKLARLLTSIVGIKTMIHSTRGNPQLLCEVTDKLLGTQDLVRNIEDLEFNRNKLIEESYGKNIIGSPVSEEIKILAMIELEATRGKNGTTMLINAVKSASNMEIYSNLANADREFGYNSFLDYSLTDIHNPHDFQKPTLADMQQKILKTEIDELQELAGISPYTDLELEIKKFLYDRISFQKHFLNRPTPKFGEYKLTLEDEEFAQNFRSDLDGETERLGGKIGLFGPGCRVYSSANAPHLVNEDQIKRLYLPGVEYNELQNCRLEVWAEKLNIAQTKSFLDDWAVWSYNQISKDQLLSNDEFPFESVMEWVNNTLNEKDQGLIEKYRLISAEKRFYMPQYQQEATMSEDIEENRGKSR